MTPLKIGVLGPGAIGGLLAARLSKAGHEVTVIATERTAVAIELTGLTLQTPHEQLETRPIARPWLTAPVEVLFVTTRAIDLPAALERVPPALLAASTIVPLLNGIDHVPLLRARYPGSRVVAASVSVEASRPRVGLTEQHSVGCEFTVTADRAPLEGDWSVSSLLRGPGLEARVDPDEKRILWRKLASLAPYALLTTSANAPLGPARERYPNWLTALANEAAEAGGRDGVSLDAGLVASGLTRAPDDLAIVDARRPVGGEAARTRRNRRADPAGPGGIGGADDGRCGPGDPYASRRPSAAGTRRQRPCRKRRRWLPVSCGALHLAPARYLRRECGSRDRGALMISGSVGVASGT